VGGHDKNNGKKTGKKIMSPNELDQSKPNPAKPSLLEPIKLDQFLKTVGIAQTGGQAKLLIQAGEVAVNGAVEVRRGRKLQAGDRVMTMGETFTVQ
jgi:ribosome-associated protein